MASPSTLPPGPLHPLPEELAVQGSAAAFTYAQQHFVRLSEVVQHAGRILPGRVAVAAQIAVRCLSEGGKLLVCGNGGSAADAQHFVAELVGRFGKERPPLAAISLTVDPSVVTCVANDYGYEQVFARQVEALGCKGDVLVALSTSGRSPNVLAALEAARRAGLSTIGLTGAGPGVPWTRCDVVMPVPSRRTPHIQEVHTALLHALCEAIENALFGSAATHQR